ncbi:CGNR zinc finger domain-containing protein [Mesorhizobium sp. RMAD-H1]|uniref:CGNR zinc finger domain-containing protein n=1 Tax=Mesorhizobium sp. RMAD-H1 TaxID=2587065 RepID=UPI0016171791|nr:CGNR zinc finger domain-containing protein [Mesorhizobium sp. RMAD-H1]MBB2973136.1 putative RNA-binding Zn ribbon-like protein [Mesorhizobium sp. RMAD-H1]
MAIEWNEHRFSGGALALDMVNTVIYREMPDRRLDRFADRREIPRFAEAAARFRAEELGGTALIPPGDEAEAGKLLSLREAINALFREAATKDVVGAGRLTAFLSHGAALTDRLPPDMALSPGGALRSGQTLPLGVAAFLSGLRLIQPERLSRVRVCPNCHWLYVDNSRNRSRRWCDMTVCGNRAKARRHYERKRTGIGKDHAPQ